MTTLIVDDNETSRKLLRLTLEPEGLDTAEAGDGVEALAILENRRVDAVISDILMPPMDGYRFCSQVRQSEQFHDVPVIIYSSTYTSPADEQLALQGEADRYITKPAPAQALIRAIRESCTAVARQQRRNKPLPGELVTLREYSDALVRKLEERNAELEEARKVLANFNQELEQKVREHSEPNRGAVFTLEQPLSGTKQPHEANPLPTQPACPGSKGNRPVGTANCITE